MIFPQEQVVGEPVSSAEEVSACVAMPQILEDIVVPGRAQTVAVGMVITHEGVLEALVEQVIPVTEDIDEVVGVIPQGRTPERITAGSVDVTVSQIMKGKVGQFWETVDGEQERGSMSVVEQRVDVSFPHRCGDVNATGAFRAAGRVAGV